MPPTTRIRGGLSSAVLSVSSLAPLPARWQDAAAVAQLGVKSPLSSVHKFHTSI